MRQVLDGLKLKTNLVQIAIPDEYVEHGNVELLQKEIGIDAEGIAGRIIEEMKGLR